MGDLNCYFVVSTGFLGSLGPPVVARARTVTAADIAREAGGLLLTTVVVEEENAAADVTGDSVTPRLDGRPERRIVGPVGGEFVGVLGVSKVKHTDATGVPRGVESIGISWRTFKNRGT